MRDSFGLVGAELGRGTYSLRSRDGRGSVQYECPRVERVFPDSPAARLGLQPGDLVLMVGVEDERYPAGWAKVRSSSELVAVMRGPTFRLGTENIWIARGDQTFRGELPVDDPALTEAFRRQRQESPAGP